MLRLAYSYRFQIENFFAENALEEEFKFFWNDSYVSFVYPVDDDTWKALQYVSVDTHGAVLGFFTASINQTAHFVDCVSAINFCGAPHPVFDRDFFSFLASLFLKFDFHKVCFSVIIGNPAEKLYDKIIERFGGRVVGTQRAHIRLWDNQLYDRKLYEVMKSEVNLKELVRCREKF